MNDLKLGSNEPQTKRVAPSKGNRWAQFSLRFLLLVMLASGAILGLLTHNSYRAKQEFAVEQELLKHDAYIIYDYQINEDWELVEHAVPPGPDWLKKFFGEKIYARIVEVEILDGETLQSTTWVPKLKDLRYLCLDKCPSLENVDDLRHTHKLESVQFYQCRKLKNIDGLSSHKNLDELVLNSNDLLESIEAIRGANKLTKLSIDRCPELKDLTPIGSLTGLERLSLPSTPLVSLQYVTNSKGLKQLSIRTPPDTQTLTELAQLTKLEHLQLADCESITDFSALHELKEIKFLSLSGAKCLDDPIAFEKAIANMSKVELISISNCPDLKKLKLPPLPKLRALSIIDADSLTEFEGFENLASLTSVSLLNCNALTNLTGLSKAKKIAAVSVASCKSLKDVSAFNGTESLRSLMLGHSFSPKDVADMQKQLPNVNVRGGLAE